MRSREGLRRPSLLGDRVLDLQPLADPLDDGVVVPRRIGDGDEKRANDETAGLSVHSPLLLQLFAVYGDALTDVDEKILKIGCAFRFPANSLYCAPLILRCLLTLKTIHAGASSFVNLIFSKHAEYPLIRLR